MNKKEVTEIKKLFTKERCCLNRLCGCYVDADKNKVVEFKEAFLSLPEEEIYKYLDIFRKSLSGTLGKNLLNMEFPLEQEMGEGTQKSLLALRDSELKDDAMLDAFYDRIIETYYHPENYLILLVHGSYDIPMKTSDGLEMDDASDYIYNFVLCCLCWWTCRNRDFYFRLFRIVTQIFIVYFIIPKMQMNSARILLSSYLAACSRFQQDSRKNLFRQSLRTRWEKNVYTMWCATSMKISMR